MPWPPSVRNAPERATEGITSIWESHSARSDTALPHALLRFAQGASMTDNDYSPSSNFKAIRKQLGITQKLLADGMGCVQAYITKMEKGGNVSPAMARKLIDFCASRGLVITFDHIYGDALYSGVTTRAVRSVSSRADIIRLAAEAVIAEAVAEEREACAKLCDQEVARWGFHAVAPSAAAGCAVLIRARGQHG